MDWLNDILSWLDKINGLSGVALTCLSCVVVGYVLRYIKPFPNDAIPVVVILWGAVVTLVIADPRATAVPARVWVMRNLCVGLVTGLIAWLLHYVVLSKIEDWIVKKFPDLSGTSFFQKTQPPKP